MKTPEDPANPDLPPKISKSDILFVTNSNLLDRKERADLCLAETVHTVNYYTVVKERKHFIIVCQKYGAIIRKACWLSLIGHCKYSYLWLKKLQECWSNFFRISKDSKIAPFKVVLPSWILQHLDVNYKLKSLRSKLDHLNYSG